MLGLLLALGAAAEVPAVSAVQAQVEGLMPPQGQVARPLAEAGLIELQDRVTELLLARIDAGDTARLTPLLAIQAPPAWPLERPGSALGLLLVSVQSGLDRWQVPLKTNLWFALRNQADGSLQIVGSIEGGRRLAATLPAKAGTPPAGAAATSLHVAADWLDMRTRLEVPLAGGGLVVTAFAGATRSNTVELRVGAPRRQAARSAAPPWWRDRPGAAPASVGPGWTFRPADQTLDLELFWPAGSAAVLDPDSPMPWVRLHVVLAEADRAPRVLPWVAAVRRVAGGPGPGGFSLAGAVDLRQALPPRSAGQGWIWVDAGDRLLGPIERP
jgi:hypothetical protein